MSPGNKNVSDGCMVIREVLSLVGDKWSVQVVAMLGHGPMRFSVLRRSIDGISQRMLTLTLRGLERDGLITRLVTPTVPPRVDYELTKLGRTLLEPVSGLVQWAGRNREKLQAARNAFDARQATLPRSARSAVTA
jgi:DNA-binding HxlR family transcriptional regulator